MTTTTIELIKTARTHGILMPVRAWRAHRATGVPYFVLCAFLMQETGGGANIYGHDVDAVGNPRPFWGAGEVTAENYAIYKQQRDLGVTQALRFPRLGRRAQGVGPMQLTFYAFQDGADAAGGCWDPTVNIRYGAGILARYKSKGLTWHQVARAWNGKESYAAQMDERFDTWRILLGAA